MGDDLRVANIARVSFDKWKEEFDQKDAKLIDYLATHEHTSPFRHVQVSIRCQAPVFLARQLGKHQVGLSWNEVSRRYVDVGVEFYVPDVWRGRPVGSVKQGSGDEEIVYIFDNAPWDEPVPIKEEYNNFLQLALQFYDDLLVAGVAPEMARMVLPQSMTVSWVWTGSLTSFFYLWRLRKDGHAQKEAQDFADLIEQVVEPLFPVCWKALKGDSNDIATN
jgi:thymidylate synthase (FAD)